MTFEKNILFRFFELTPDEVKISEITNHKKAKRRLLKSAPVGFF